MIIGSEDQLSIRLDWVTVDPDLGLTHREQATWCRLALYVEGRNVTENVDSGEQYGDAVFLSILPLCAWIAENWETIFTVEQRPQENGAEDPFRYLTEAASGVPDEADNADDLLEDIRRWWETHSLRASRNGEALPDVVFWRQGADIVVAWDSDDKPFGDANVRFVARPGAAQFPARTIASAFLELMGVVEERLNSQGITGEEGPLIEEFLRNHAGLRDETYRFTTIVRESALPPELFALAAGLNLEELGHILSGERRPTEEEWRTVIDAFRIPTGNSTASLLEASVGSEVLALFRSASPTLTAEDVRRLIDLVAGASERPQHVPLDEVRDSVGFELERDLPPYRVGQLRARGTREVLALGIERVDVEQLVAELIEASISECALSDRTIDAVSLWSEQLGPTVAVNTDAFMGSTPWGRRMAIAHELCHLLFDTSAGRPLGIASGRSAPVVLEKIANAFAAEFLLPRQAVARARYDVKTDAGFQQLLGEYDVGVTVAAHQLANHGFISEAHKSYYLKTFGHLAD